MKLIPLKVGRARIGDPHEEMLHVSLREALGHGPDARLVIDHLGQVLQANQAGQALAAALEDATSDARAIVREWAEDDFLGSVSLTLKDGVIERRFTLHAIPVVRGNGMSAAILIGREPDMAGHLMQALSASRQLYKDLVGCAGAIAWETDIRGRFSYLNGAQSLGYDVLELMGEDPAFALGLDGEIATAVFSAQEPIQEVELWPLKKDGERACMVISAMPVFDANGVWQGARGMARDVTRERQQADALAKARDTLARMALTDELTGLLNRRAFDEQVAVRIAHGARANRVSALLMIDLDFFKAVNDTLGHAAGDSVLKALGDVMDRMLRVGDLAARLGGDEFAVWLEDTDAEGAQHLAGRLIGQIDALRAASGSPLCKVSMSIGIAICHHGAPELDALKADADEALYAAKGAGRAQYILAGKGK